MEDQYLDSYMEDRLGGGSYDDGAFNEFETSEPFEDEGDFNEE